MSFLINEVPLGEPHAHYHRHQRFAQLPYDLHTGRVRQGTKNFGCGCGWFHQFEDGKADFPFYWSATTHAGLHGGGAAMYVAFGRAAGWMSVLFTGRAARNVPAHGERVAEEFAHAIVSPGTGIE